MTSPNLNNRNQVPDAVNAGAGIGAASRQSSAAHLQGQMDQVAGPLGSVAGWMLAGLAPTLIADATEAGETGGSPSYIDASGRVMDAVTGVRSQVTDPLEHLINSLLSVFGIDPMGSLNDKVMDLSDFFDDLLDGGLVIQVLGTLIGMLTGTPPQAWTSVEDIQNGIIPAIARIPIQIVVDLLGNVPVVGDAVQSGFADWLQHNYSNTISAQVTANQALTMAMGILAGGTGKAESFEGNGALDPAKWWVQDPLVVRRDDKLGANINTNDGTWPFRFVYLSPYNTDNQTVATVLAGTPRNGFDMDSALHVRSNNIATRYTYLHMYDKKMYLGHATYEEVVPGLPIAGYKWVYHDWVEKNVNLAPGSSVQLKVVGNKFEVKVNGITSLTYTDTAETGPKGEGFRYSGGRITQKRATFTNWHSFWFSSFAMSDA